jgi:hypothetical protein
MWHLVCLITHHTWNSTIQQPCKEVSQAQRPKIACFPSYADYRPKSIGQGKEA